MSRINYIAQLKFFAIYVLMQLPLLYKFVLFDRAFGFIYLGFLLFIPYGINPFLKILTGFAVGLFIDIFSNTPGLHASVGTLLMFVRDGWLRLTSEDIEDDTNFNVFHLGFIGSIIYMLPLIFIHLLLLFWIESGNFAHFFAILPRVFFSTIFSFVCILIFNLLIAKKTDRL